MFKSIEYKRAKTVVEQLKRGEWKGRFNDIASGVLTLERDGVSLWVANTSFDCEIHYPKSINYFGYFWRHWVWFVAQKERRESELIFRDKEKFETNNKIDDRVIKGQ